MKNPLFLLNACFLFLCVSMYLGTGWSLWLFSFPIAPQLTPDNYYNQFVPQVTAATNFFRIQTMLMLLSAGLMVVDEWRSWRRWFPIGVLIGVMAATALTILYIFPYNASMAAGIQDQATLDDVLTKWMRLNRIRVSLWTFQWLCMMAYFAVLVYPKPLTR
ncbi:hypothetical protein SAMN05421823_10471 [Catalinimonas alkaloidigena]|uniref:DUF1772 domain-containing protein n=1 Tax=Catalinimonas alkaloidigena TaxID=1075417 RepID=A0A1G9GDB5_9BACT|nr:hypothetical protein [Catalinimonas alkaloidigena]SDK98602.1 hypothetical protein SAMN05421823_10471 [Catalinimonas alkaloidigena]